jgi:hypothetical protein
VENLTRRMAELAVDDDSGLPWTIEVTSINIVVSAETREVYADEVAAWEGARVLWRATLDLGYELTDEGQSEIGAIRRWLGRDKTWRGKVRMVLKPL